MARQKVEVFELSNLSEKTTYEKLLNKDSVTVIKEQFAYLKDGTPVITIWYVDDELE